MIQSAASAVVMGMRREKIAIRYRIPSLHKKIFVFIHEIGLLVQTPFFPSGRGTCKLDRQGLPETISLTRKAAGGYLRSSRWNTLIQRLLSGVPSFLIRSISSGSQPAF